MSDKRQAILDAALELFVDRGFHGTAVPAVAQRAGVGAGTIYRYFASKEKLVNELFQLWKRQMAGHMMDAFAGEAPPRERFHRLWRSMVAFATAHPLAFRFLELHHHGSYLDAASRQVEGNLIDTAARLIASLQAAKILRPGEPHVLMALIHWSLVGLIRGCGDRRFELSEENLALAEDALWQAIRRPD